ncbi:MAG: lasso RiPP family leader peptide-containing protein [Pseudomonadota bacterium]
MTQDAKTETRYGAPKLVKLGSVSELTRAGGDKVTDSWKGDTHTAIDWNKHNSVHADVIDPDALD